MTESLAEQSATAKGLKVLALPPSELAGTALTGDPIIVKTVDGEEMLLRLPTVEEAMRFNREAVDHTNEMCDFDPPLPYMTRAKAEEIVRPLQPRAS